MKKILLILLMIIMLPITVKAESKYLYDVLKNEAENNGLAKEYTGEHHDSFTEEPSKKIYHWYAENDEEGNLVLEKNNVIFANHCWQMIRTTDTGGVKLIYNGVPTEGKCNNTGIDQQIGTSTFNADSKSPAYVGYMYNTVYRYDYKSPPIRSYILERIEMVGTTNYYYGTDVTYNPSTNQYVLANTTQATWRNKYSSATGLYTCKSETATQCSTVYYIVGGENSYMYGFSMTDGNLLNYYNTNLTLGTGYTESNGIYTLTGTTTITKANWFSNYATYHNYYTCGDATTSCTDMGYITYENNYDYYALNLAYNHVYAKDFTYNSETNKYVLSSDRYQSWNMTDTDKNNINTHHYTCFNGSGECSTLSYVYFTRTPSFYGYIYYINLTDGKSVEDAINEMLYNNNVNTTNSIIKTTIDNWYASNMTEYTSKLEDTIFCNDRSQDNQAVNGWNPNGGSVTKVLLFKNNNDSSNSLSCTNDTDKFSLSNNKAQLTYPVGLLTLPETNLLNNTNILKTGKEYWLASPDFFDEQYAGVREIYSTGINAHVITSINYGVRPVVSLKNNIKYISGDGSKNSPYIIDNKEYYKVNIEINNETENLTVEIDDLSQVPEGETVNFKVTPIKGRKVTSIRIIDEDNNEIEYTTPDNKNYTFTMPSTDVTIIPSYERVKNAVNVEDNKNTKEFVIEVNDSQAVVYEDTVRFRVDPEEGYEVEKIEITDEEQNNINYRKTNNINEYEFTMPDTNVLIKPFYRLINKSNIPNPNTKRQILLIVISVIILTIMTFIYIKKKKRLT